MKSVRASDTGGWGGLRASVRDFGYRRVASSIVVGLGSLVLTAGTTYVGVVTALGRTELAAGPPEDLFGNAIVLIGAVLIAALGGIVGFTLGVTVLPAILVGTLGWSRPIQTGLTILALEVITVPVLVLIVYRFSDRPLSQTTLLASFTLIGGVVPAAGRFLNASDRGPSSDEPTA